MFIVLFYKNNREKYINNEKYLTTTNKCFKLYIVLYKDVKLWKMK